MKRLLLYILAVLLFPLLSFAQEQTYSIEIDAKSIEPVQTDALSGVMIDKIGLDRSMRPCARIKMRINRMTGDEISQLSVVAVGGVVEVMKQIVANKEEGNGLIIELTAKPETRFYLRHPKYGDSNEVSLALEGNKEYRINAELNYLHTIVVKSNVVNADVYLDDTFKGRTGSDLTLIINDVLPGQHKLRVEYEGEKNESSIEVRADKVYFPVNINQEQSKSHPVVFSVAPKGAIVTINGSEIPLYNGENITSKENGTYTYFVSAKDYRSEEGEIVVSGSEVRKSISLRPAFGFLSVPARGELKDASVYVNGELLRTQSLSNHRLMSGVYNIRITKEYYKDYEAQIEIKDGDTLYYEPQLEPNFAKISLNVGDDSELYINGKYKGVSSWNGILLSGTYTFEARKKYHRTISKEVVVSPSQSCQRIEIPALTPILGKLSIDSTPSSAEVYIDGEFVGATPFERDIIIGEHRVTVSKDGCDDHKCDVTIEEGKTTSLTPHLLKNQATVTVIAAEGFDICIDDEFKAKSSWCGVVKTGTHTFEARKVGYRTTSIEKEITSQSSSHIIELETPTPIYGKLEVESDPDGAQVYVDDKQVGETPFSQSLIIGEHTVALRLGGYQNFSRNITIEEDTTYPLNVELQKPQKKQTSSYNSYTTSSYGKRSSYGSTRRSNSSYREHQNGFESIIELSSIVSPLYYGWALSLTYTAGYRFNNFFYLGGGTGIYYSFAGEPSERYTDAQMDYVYYSDNEYFLSPCAVSVPIFAYCRANFLNRRCSPFFALAIGGNISAKQTLHLDLYDAKYGTSTFYVTPQLGFNFRTSTKASVYIAVGVPLYIAPHCNKYNSYNAMIIRKFDYCCDARLGVTF